MSCAAFDFHFWRILCLLTQNVLCTSNVGFFPENLHFVCFVTWNWLYRFMHLNMMIKSNLYRNEDSCSIQRFSRRILCRVLLQSPGRHLIQSSRSSSLAMITSAKRITKRHRPLCTISSSRFSTLQPTVGQSLSQSQSLPMITSV